MQKVPFFTRVNSSPNEVQALSNHPPNIKHNVVIRGSPGNTQQQREQVLEYGQLVPQSSQSPQQQPQASPHQLQKPKTSAATHRIQVRFPRFIQNQLLHNGGEGLQTIANTEQTKAPLKMKVHNFDSLGLAGTNIEAIGAQTIPLDHHALRASMNQLHVGNVQTKNLFLNTFGGNPASSVQGFSSPTGSGSKNKMFTQQLQQQFAGACAVNHKNMKILQQIPPNQMVHATRAQSNQQQIRSQQQRQVFSQRKIINAQQTAQPQPQFAIIASKKDANQQQLQSTLQSVQSTPGILQSLALESNKGQHPLIQTSNSAAKMPFSGRMSMQLRGQSQNCQRKAAIEDKNLKYFNNAIQNPTTKMFDIPASSQSHHAKNKNSQGTGGVSSYSIGVNDYDHAGVNIRLTGGDNEESMDGSGGGGQAMMIMAAGGSPPAAHRYANFEYNSSAQNLQIARGNSEPGFQKKTELMSAISNTGFQDQITTTQIQHQKTVGGSTVISPSQMKWPVKNTQGLQGSIYSSSATSSIEGDNNIIFLNDSNEKQLTKNHQHQQHMGQSPPVDNKFIVQRDEQNPQAFRYSADSKKQLFFLQRNSQQSSPDYQIKASVQQDYEQQLNLLQQQQPQMELHRFTLIEESKKNFASTLNPQALSSGGGLFGEGQESLQLHLQQQKSNNKKYQRQVISKNNIKFASTMTTSNPLTAGSVIAKVPEGAGSTTSVGVSGSGTITPGNPAALQNMQSQGNQETKGAEVESKFNTKKTLSKLREAQQIADSVDKKGIDNAIVQYQFELADKDEENCFKDLYDTLNEFF